jgi:TetR/AcrR family transcriptional regulator, transcriptional repressor for nem operon
MAYPPGHRATTRGKIVESARRLFNRHGFDAVSVKQIMSGAGRTHGAFYSYFKGKSDLYTEVLGCFFTDPNWKNRWEGVEVDLNGSNAGSQIVEAYLSRQHIDDVENSCPMVALPTDVRRSGRSVKNAFEEVFEAMVRVLEASVAAKAGSQHERAQAIAALCIGGVVVARAMRSEAGADALRKACMAIALKIGGWEDSSAVRSAQKAQRRGKVARDTRLHD